MTKPGIRFVASAVGLILIGVSPAHPEGPHKRPTSQPGRPTGPHRQSAAPRAQGDAKPASGTPAPRATSQPAAEKRVAIQYDGHIYTWYPDRTVIMVDIDGTISTTNYLELTFSSRDRKSRPMNGSVEVLAALARDYNIAYTTFRSDDAANKTREWLSLHGFPAGPLIYGSGFGDWSDQAKYKTHRFAQLRQTWPNLLIGIGDRSVDVKSCCENRMLSLVVNKSDPDHYHGRAIVLADWPAVGQYFARNRAVLKDPAKLALRIDANGRLRPLPEAATAVPQSAGN